MRSRGRPARRRLPRNHILSPPGQTPGHWGGAEVETPAATPRFRDADRAGDAAAARRPGCCWWRRHRSYGLDGRPTWRYLCVSEAALPLARSLLRGRGTLLLSLAVLCALGLAVIARVQPRSSTQVLWDRRSGFIALVGFLPLEWLQRFSTC
jgi:hypothetical protein